MATEIRGTVQETRAWGKLGRMEQIFSGLQERSMSAMRGRGGRVSWCDAGKWRTQDGCRRMVDTARKVCRGVKTCCTGIRQAPQDKDW